MLGQLVVVIVEIIHIIMLVSVLLLLLVILHELVITWRVTSAIELLLVALLLLLAWHVVVGGPVVRVVRAVLDIFVQIWSILLTWVHGARVGRLLSNDSILTLSS